MTSRVFNQINAAMLNLLVCIALGQSNSEAQDWPNFRGPSGNGVLEKLTYPVEWSEEKNMAWAVDLPGGGLSSPVVHSNRIFLTTAIGAKAPVSFSEGVRDMRPKKPGKASQIPRDLF